MPQSASLPDAALFDLSHYGQVELAGTDAVSFLHNLSTNDIKQLVPGSGCEAFLITAQAKVVAHVLVYRLPPTDKRDVLWLDCGPLPAEKVIGHLERYHITEDVELTDRTRDLALLHVAGPRAQAVVENLLKVSLPNLPELHHITHSLHVDYAFWQIRRHTPLGLPGYDLVCPKASAEKLWESQLKSLLFRAARPQPAEFYDALRVEAGTPVNGLDIDETSLPQEVGRIEQTISFTKGCYIGQETVARIRTYGHVNRSLVGLRLAGEGPAPRGAKLFRDGKEVGQVTSSVHGPRLGVPVAMAYVRRGSQEPGTVLEVETAAARRSAEVISLPFVGSAP